MDLEPLIPMNAPWFKLWLSWLDDADFDNLPLEAQAIAVRMWAVQWREGSIPGDPEELARKCRVRASAMHVHMQNIMQLFMQRADGSYVFEPIEFERRRSGLVSRLRSKAAQRRWNQELNASESANADARGHANADASANASACRRQKTEDEKTEGKKPSTSYVRKRTTDSNDATSIYLLYPRKVAKAAAIKSIVKAIQRVCELRQCSVEETVQFMRDRTSAFAQSAAGQRGEYTPHAATWFNRESYFDDPAEWRDNRHVKANGVFRPNRNAGAYAEGADLTYDNTDE